MPGTAFLPARRDGASCLHLMNIVKDMNGSALTITLEGRLDRNTAPELEDVLRDSMQKADTLVLDLAEVDYVSSAGLRVLLFAYKTMSRKGGMTTRHVNERVLEIFEVANLTNLLTIES